MAKEIPISDKTANNFITKLAIKIILSLYIVLSIATFVYFSAHTNLIPMSAQLELWLHLAYGYWIAITFLIIQIGLGRFLFRLPLLKEIKLNGFSYLIFCQGCGFYVSSFFLLVSAWLFQLNSFTVFLYILMALPAALLGIKTIKEVVFFIYSKKTKNPKKNKLKLLAPLIVVILFLIWFTPFFIQTLTPNTDWDGAAYHLPSAKRFLEGKITTVDPTFYHYNFAGAINLVYSLFFALNAETAIVPFNFLTSIFIIFTVYSLTLMLWNRKAAIWAALICTAVNLLWEVSLTPRIDTFLTFYFLLACYAFLFWIPRKEKSGLLIITGMMLGITMGIKFTAVFFVIIIFSSIMVLTFKEFKKNCKLILTSLILSALAIAIPSGWWYVRNAAALGDPIYPLLSGRFFYDNNGNKINFDSTLDELLKKMPPEKETYAAMEYFYETPLSYKEATQTKKYHHLFNIWDILTNPEKYQRNPYHEINIFLLLFFLLPFFSRKKQLLWLYGISLALYIIIGSQTYLVRYALPVFPLFSIGAGIVISRVRSKALFIVLSMGLCFNLFYFSYFEWLKVSYMQPAAYLCQEKSRVEWLTEIGYNLKLQDTPLFIKYVNEKIDNGYMGKDDILFMIGENKGNLLKCNYLPDPGQLPVRWLEELMKAKTNYQQIIDNFRKRKIEYIVVNKAFFQVMLKEPKNRQPITYGLYHLSRFLKKHTVIVYNKKEIILAKLIK